MSAPNQFKITLNREKINMKPGGFSWTAFYDHNLNKALSRLNKGGIIVYCYLCEQIPHYYNSIKNSNNKNMRPFEFSPSAVAEEIQASRDTISRGFKELIQYGYLVEKEPNHFLFTDYLGEDKPIVSSTIEKEERILNVDIIINEELNNNKKENRITPLSNISSGIPENSNQHRPSWLLDNEQWP